MASEQINPFHVVKSDDKGVCREHRETLGLLWHGMGR